MAVSEGHSDIDVHILHAVSYLIAHRFAGNVIEVHAVESIINAVAKSDNSAIDETAHLIRQSGFEFMRDDVRDDVCEVGLIEGDRTERTVLLLGEV